MLKQFAVISTLILLGACASGPVTVSDPLLPEEAPGRVSVAAINIAYSDLAADVIKEDDRERSEKRDMELAPSEDLAALPLKDVLKLAITKELSERGILGQVPVEINISVDTMKYQNGLATILLGSNDQLAAQVSVLHATTGEILSDFYVDQIRSHGGLLGLAVRGWGIRERMSEDFANHVADQLYSDE